jgi:hypothetical protein
VCKKQILVGAYANLANGSIYGGRTQIMADLIMGDLVLLI